MENVIIISSAFIEYVELDWFKWMVEGGQGAMKQPHWNWNWVLNIHQKQCSRNRCSLCYLHYVQSTMYIWRWTSFFGIQFVIFIEISKLGRSMQKPDSKKKWCKKSNFLWLFLLWLQNYFASQLKPPLGLLHTINTR